jgi:hypothetical protein
VLSFRAEGVKLTKTFVPLRDGVRTETRFMGCKTCDDLLAVYRSAVSLYKTTVRDSTTLLGDELRLASQETERLRLACRDADNALITHWRQVHKNLAKKAAASS